MRANGFTLVELLVAMVAGSLLLIGIGWGVSGLARDLQGHGASDQLQRHTMAAAFLTRYLERATLPAKPAQAVFEEDHVRVAVPPPAALGPVGRILLDLTLSRGTAGTVLIASLDAPTGRALPDIARGEHILSEALKRATFSFEPREGRGAEAYAMPKLIRLDIVMRNGEERRIAVLPLINSQGGCTFDPIAQTCR